MNEKWSAILRLALFALPLLNAILVMAGTSPLPIDEHQLENLFLTIGGFVAAIWAWWKNSDITKKAQLKKEATEGKSEAELIRLAGK